MNTIFKDMDNAKLLMIICGVMLLVVNLGLICFLLFVDGRNTEGLLSFLQQEITWLIPSSAVVSVIQHGVSTFFGSRQAKQQAEG